MGARPVGDGSASSRGRRLARRAQPGTRAHHGFVRFGMAVRLISAERVGQHALAPQLPAPLPYPARRSSCARWARILLPDQVEQRTERPARLGSLAVVTSCRPVGRPHYRACWWYALPGEGGSPSEVPVTGTRRLRLAVRGPVEQLGVLATLSRWRSRVQIPSGPRGSPVRFHWDPS